MFPWNIARSAEAMFSRWAMKRVCKFVLKKKLGKFILGDIDLNQLDVQLSAGTIQLSDLALNVDYLNQKFGSTSAVVMKEGSIGSLMVMMPWKGDGCSVEVDELELVFAPRSCHDSGNGSGACTSSREPQDHYVSHGSPNLEHDTVDNAGRSTSLDVHEGVKTIANMVKWLLTKFHVKIRKVIVAFDPSFAAEKDKGLSRILVLRLTEIDCGTCISESASSDCEVMAGNLLGLSQMTNFVKFQGVVLEFLHMNGIDDKTPYPCASGTTVGEWSSGPYRNVTIPVITGERGGFSGSLKLYIPWNNGSLDIHKVEADAFIDPLQLKFQPTSVRSFIHLWEIFKDMGDKNRNSIISKATESDHCNEQLNYGLSNTDSCRLAEEVLPRHKYFSAEYLPQIDEDPVTQALLSESHLIPDWLRSQKDKIEEPDFGASVDQFFECFDGLRNSQSALGSSGMWNWTCSVFSAITAASTLASGSLHIPSDQLHVETNLRATISKISIIFFFTDEDDKHCSSAEAAQITTGSSVHYMSAHFNDLSLVLQVRRHEMNFEAKVQHVGLVDCFSSGDVMLNDGKDIEEIQGAVQNAIPHIPRSSEKGKLNNLTGATRDVSMLSDYRCTHPQTFRGPDDVVQVKLLETVGDIQCQIRIDSSGDSFIGPMSFSLKLPYFIFWVNIDLVCEIFELLKQIGDSFERTSIVAPCEDYQFSSKTEEMKSSFAQENLMGNVFIPNARIILCFPFGKGGGLRSYASWEHLIALDLSSSIPTGNKRDAMNQTSIACSKNMYSLQTSRSLHLSFGGLNIYLITLASEENVDSSPDAEHKQRYLAQNIMSISCGTQHSVVSLFWQESPVVASGDMVKKAKLLASSDINGTRDRFRGKDYEFASVSTVKDSEDFDGIQQKMIESSEFFIHARISPLVATLSKSQYVCIHHLLSQLIDRLSQISSVSADTKETSSASQASVLIECESLTISIGVEVVENVKGSLQYELPGYWHSLRLEVKKFGFYSASNIGRISNTSFLRVLHIDGNLWGHISGVAREEVLLISCNDASMGRGDGDGSNVIFSKRSGSEIIHLLDPQSLSNYTSITVRCGTIVAVGGRLDWLDRITSFFSLPSPETEQCDDSSQKQCCKESLPFECSFVLNLVDIGLSYEPYLMFNKGSDFKLNSGNGNEVVDKQHVACLLAASSLRISNTSFADSAVRDYKISVRDLGLLLSVVGEPGSVGHIYGVEHLRKIGYVKVAQEANIEALLRINCENGNLWEVECSGSQIFLNTCHDTTSGLICLATQLQQLFAPDMEESVVHLQTRWDNVQQDNGSKELWTFEVNNPTSTSTVLTSIADVECKASIINIMDEICEDAFQVEGISDAQADTCESPVHVPLNDSCIGEACYYSNIEAQHFCKSLPLTESSPAAGLENGESSFSEEKLPEFIEDYVLSDLCPRSEVSLKSNSPNDILKCKTSSLKNGDDQQESSGWYDDSSLRILEDHVSKASGHDDSLQYVECESSSSQTETDENGKIKGRIVFNDVNVTWRLYAGSDWQNIEKSVQCSAGTYVRDITSYLELILSGVGFKYDVFPDGGIHVSRLSIAVQDFFLNDRRNDAPWKLVLGYYQAKHCPRKSSSKAIKLDLEAVRPDPAIPLEEYRLRIAFLPILLHLHQSQLDFLISIFGGINSASNSSQGASQNLCESKTISQQKTVIGGHVITMEALLPYFQKFDIWPTLVRVDYSPCRVDLAALRGGKYVELINLVPWKGVEMNLKHVHAVGVYGWGSVCETIIGEWLEDISQNQIHKLLKGLPPIRSLVAVGSGATKLVSLPVKSYKKDHKLLKGMQRGTFAFLRSISLEAIGLGVHLAAGAHEILLQAEYILTSIPPSMPLPAQNRGNSVRSNQPVDARQGIQQACDSISVGFSKSASALVRTPLKRYQRGAGVGNALMTAVKGAPAAAIAPASATARALHCALVGVRNSLDPDRKKESLDKYLGTSPPQQFM
nr:autophagy-related protein 2 isoform X1 [Ipomoea trifida]